jgi:hypothetical protein
MTAAQTQNRSFTGYADLPRVRLWHTDSGGAITDEEMRKLRRSLDQPGTAGGFQLQRFGVYQRLGLTESIRAPRTGRVYDRSR